MCGSPDFLTPSDEKRYSAAIGPNPLFFTLTLNGLGGICTWMLGRSNNSAPVTKAFAIDTWLAPGGAV